MRPVRELADATCELLARLGDGALCRSPPDGEARLVAGSASLARLLGVRREDLERDMGAALSRRSPELLAALAAPAEEETDTAVVPVSLPGEGIRWLSVRRARGESGELLALIRDETPLRESLKKAAAAQSKEVENSARLQAAVLMEGGKREIAGLDYQTATVPSRLVDGDFIEVISLSDESVDFILGDVMGKGMDAGIVGAMIKLGFVRFLASALFGAGELPDPSSICEAVESDIAPRLIARQSFATITYARLDAPRRALRFVDCGHTSIVQYSRASGECWRVKGGNMPMGFTANQRYRAFTLPVDPGDCVILFTDGLSECRNRWDEALDEERIMYMLRTYSDLPASALAGTIMRIGFDYSAAGFNDDVSIVCFKSLAEGGEVLERLRSARLSPSGLGALGEIESGLAEDLGSWAPGLDAPSRAAIVLACHEALVNVAEHALPAEGGECGLRWRLAAGLLSLEIAYAGPDYGWSAEPSSPIASFAESGYGRTIMHEAMDSVLVARGHHGMKRLIMCREIGRGRRG
jgi:serine phosphatase RsbU (regulator of sigma subunit)/anti-sigma regulatory factor (Ser/Thr protein kinase)